MYKVFVNQDEIILTCNVPFGDKISIYDLKEISILEIVKLVKKQKRIFLFHKNPKKLISTFAKKIKIVTAAGGVVTNKKDEILFIFRRNKWDLPKGKMDKGETIKDTALREVMEETGIDSLKIIDFKMITFHIFKKGKEFRLKETHWFNMKSDYDGEFNPESREGITKVVWKTKKKVKKIKNTFPNIKLLLET